MKELVFFITHHWVLVALLGVVLFAFIINEIIGGHIGSKQLVSVERAVQMINHQEAVVFDVRTEAEFSAGHIVGAESLAVTTFDKKINHFQKYRERPAIIATANGQDTTKIMALLKSKGFLKVCLLNGGMQGWKSAGMPVVKS